MKTLILVRHAKSSWEDFSVPDFDRPLNDRGKRDAPIMAQRLKAKKINPPCWLASPAKRAQKTAELFAEQLHFAPAHIQWRQELYLASPATFTQVISETDDQYEQVILFSHNNGLTDFANELTDVRIDNIPTCGIFAVEIDASQWKDFAVAKKKFWFFDYPKNK